MLDANKYLNLAHTAEMSFHNKKTVTEAEIDEALEDAIAFLTLRKTWESFSEDEIAAARRELLYQHTITMTQPEILLADYDGSKWYEEFIGSDSFNPFFWPRYRNYLAREKGFSEPALNKLSETLDTYLLPALANPASPLKQERRRGLTIGDVQSGKTSTYIGLMSKAADAGYKVFILLTGIIEPLRRQTQQRVEEGFVGTDGTMKVGVGLDNKPIRTNCLTTRKRDFSDKADQITLDMHGDSTYVFVIKKNKSVLEKLYNWFSNRYKNFEGKIDFPLLLIDDEADNASINTSKKKENPSTINKLVRNILDLFTHATYVGFTATPYANVFIDPETTEEMTNADLFPEDFIFALPTPSNYIGAKDIFLPSGKYHNQLNYIRDAQEQLGIEDLFGYRHVKEWEGQLPDSLTDAIYAFYLANAIRDIRGHAESHRSMMINISRFQMVQRYIGECVEDIHNEALIAVKHHLSRNLEKSLRNPVIARIYRVWQECYADTPAECGGVALIEWDDIARVLFRAMEPIDIKVINVGSKAKLDYDSGSPIRVIAIGGLGLSRGLTLEGLIVSYFYRNTSTYDVLMQMGRWFGYRKDYDDLFRIWIGSSTARWYGQISEATEELKEDMHEMNKRKVKPAQFGIRVRNDSDELEITARNKRYWTRTRQVVKSFYGNYQETPYISGSAYDQEYNFLRARDMVEKYLNEGYKIEYVQVDGIPAHNMIRNVPANHILDFLRLFKIPAVHTQLEPSRAAGFIQQSNEERLKTWDIAFIEGMQSMEPVLLGNQSIRKIKRGGCTYHTDRRGDYISIGRKGRLGGPADGQAGIFNPAIIRRVKEQDMVEACSRDGGSADNYEVLSKKRTIPTDAWFRLVSVRERNPLLLIYIIQIECDDDASKDTHDFIAQLDTFGHGAIGIGVGIPASDAGDMKETHIYTTNEKYDRVDIEENEEYYDDGEGDGDEIA